MNISGIVQTMFGSLITIILLHYCYQKLVESFVLPSNKRDLGRFHQLKYQQLVKELQQQQQQTGKQTNNNTASYSSTLNASNEEFLPTNELERLQASLYEFVADAL